MMGDQQERKKRSVTLLKNDSKKKEQLKVDFDEHGQAIGDNQARFASYYGVQTRTMISILNPTWKKVPRAETDRLWLTIKEHWNIEDDKYKKTVIQSCNAAWKAYKKRLVQNFLKKGKDPVKVYPYLDETTWQEFVKMKLTSKFQIEKDTQASQGNWVPGPREDPRTKVLGSEHPSRTRAVGHVVGMRQVLPRICEKKRKRYNLEKLDEIIYQKMEEKMRVMSAKLDELHMLVQQLMAKNECPPVASPEVRTSSCGSTPAFDELDDIEVPTRCDIMLPYGTLKEKCAVGMIFPIKDRETHQIPLLPDHIEVMMNHVLLQLQYLPLPVPTEDMGTLIEACNCFVQWPRKAIVLIAPVSLEVSS